MILGKSIRIFLVDGSVTGIKIGEIINQTIKCIACPRNRLAELLAIEGINKPGIYFLFGIDEETGQDKVYVGEAENIIIRLQEHIIKKDFWNEVIFFVNKDDNLTKAHIRYLEGRVIDTSIKVKRYIIENVNITNLPSLPTADISAMEEFLIYLKLLLGVFGHKFLDDLIIEDNVAKYLNNKIEVVSSVGNESLISKNILLHLNVGKYKANGLFTDEGLIVIEGSEAAIESDIQLSLQNGYRSIRQRLIKNNIMELVGEKYIFKQKYLFDSPSAAAAIIVGYSINGREHWKDERGVSLKKIEENKIAETTK